MGYVIAWVVVAVAGLGVLAGLVWCSRVIRSRYLRSMLRSIAAVWLLLPAPVPAAEGYFAPAYVVLLFEAVFQPGGDPWPAARILMGGTAVVLAAFAIGFAIRRWRHPAGAG